MTKKKKKKIIPDPDKVKELQHIKVPKNQKQLRSFHNNNNNN